MSGKPDSVGKGLVLARQVVALGEQPSETSTRRQLLGRFGRLTICAIVMGIAYKLTSGKTAASTCPYVRTVQCQLSGPAVSGSKCQRCRLFANLGKRADTIENLQRKHVPPGHNQDLLR